MGTRHIALVQIDGKYKVACRGSGNGWPSDQGLEILDFLRKVQIETFVTNCRKIIYVDFDHEFCPGVEGSACNTLQRVSNLHLMQWDTNRWTTPPHMHFRNDVSFVGQSLYCEWAYVVDIDHGTFEVFKGLNQTPLDKTERFYSFVGYQEFEPVKHVVTFMLNNLPSNEVFMSYFPSVE